METKFYEFTQNNSGGSFDVDVDVCNRLFIEAENFQDANKKAQELGVYFDGCYKDLDCSCCGDRWHEVSEFDALDLKKLSKSYDKEFTSIEDYAQYVADRWGIWTSPDARIFYINGSRKEIFNNK